MPYYSQAVDRFSKVFKWRVILDVVATVLMIAAASIIIWTNWRAPTRPGQRPSIPLPEKPISIDGAAGRGASDAKAVIVAFTDFQCPFCKRFATEMLPALDREYLSKGQARLIVKHFPLIRIHAEALTAAIGAECAHRAGRFWPFHDELFAISQRLDKVLIRDAAVRAGVEPPKWDACISSRVASETVQSDIALAERLQVRTTPTFLIGSIESSGAVKVTKVIVGPRSVDPFRAAIDSIVQPKSSLFRFLRGIGDD